MCLAGGMAEVITSGSGEVEREPDRAGLSVSYSATGRDRTAATTALTALIDPVERALDRTGVTVRNRSLGVHSTWERSRRTSARATQSYQLLITDLAVLEDLLATLVATEPTSLHGPQWSLAASAEAVREAQRLAVADARERAAGLAEAAEVRLGELLRITDGTDGGGSGPRYAPGAMMARGAPGGAPDLSALNLEPVPVVVTANCTATWRLD
jgi:uncharacterized protein